MSYKSEFLANSESSATIIQFPASPTKLLRGSPPATPTSRPSSRLVSFGPGGSPSMTAMARFMDSPGAGSRILRASISSSNSQHDLAPAMGGGNSPVLSQSPRPNSSPQPPTQSRSRSRISQSGSMANLMNLVRSKSRSRAESSTGGAGWFGKAYSFIRPWAHDDEHSGDGDHGGASEERKRALVETRDSVMVTLKKILGTVGDVALDSLVVSGTVLQHLPVPYLQRVCTTLISIWQGVQQVSMNRLAFLRLTQTCSSILDSISKELEGADEDIIQGLHAPIQVLESSFEKILSVIETQINTPFLWRYARREDTHKEIAGCNDSLMRALALFTSAIQLRTYQAVRANAKAWAENYQQLKILAEQAVVLHRSPTLTALNAIGSHHDPRRASVPDGLPATTSRDDALTLLSPSPTIVSRSVDSFFRNSPEGLTHSPTSSFVQQRRPPTAVIPVLQELQTSQNAQDALVDVEELRRSMKAILDTGNDVAILSYLGIDKADIPEAIKTLQRLGESRGKEGGGGLPGLPRYDGMERDTLHQEFIEAGIDALRRMSDGAAVDLPYWTITPFEIQRGPKIGMGLFSEVFQGKWEGRTVAVKVLSEVTPSDLFVREIKVWKGLRHPNVLKLYGASSATGNPPWFFVSPHMRNGNLAEFLRRIARLDPDPDRVDDDDDDRHCRRTAAAAADSSDCEWAGRLGTIVENLAESKSRGCFGMGTFRLLKMDDMCRMMQEVARAMEYLHLKGILHGDLKASNVLVDDNNRCVISDFGQSELRSEVCRITGSSMKTGTLRWKAPELLEGSGMLTPSTDVYAFAIVCVEVLGMGELPWGCISDDEIRQHVLDMDKRPMIPAEFTSSPLHDLIVTCWHRDPAKRTPFNEIVFRLHRLRTIVAGDGYVNDPTTTATAAAVTSDDESWMGRSPCMSPRSSFSRPLSPSPTPHSEFFESFDCRDDFLVCLPSPELEVDDAPRRLEDNNNGNNVLTGGVVWKMPEPVHFFTPPQDGDDPKLTKDDNCYYYNYNGGTPCAVGNSESDLSRSMLVVVESGRQSSSESSSESSSSVLPPTPTNVVAATDATRNERRYRYLLEHEFNSSLTLPLWEPSPVQIGDVGYLSKPRGAFVTLFNAIKPGKFPNTAAATNVYLGRRISDYGSAAKGSMRLEKRSAAQKGLDAFSGFLAFRSRAEGPVGRRQAFRLRAGHKCAILHTESAEYHYMKKLDAAKAWFRGNIDQILSVYGREHNVQKEEVFLVISVLQARDYALFVSHRHPNGNAYFNVVNGARKGRPWGTFTCDKSVHNDRNGPLYDDDEPEDVVEHEFAAKVSLVNDPAKAVLLGRLRFKPDSMDPTTSK